MYTAAMDSSGFLCAVELASRTDCSTLAAEIRTILGPPNRVTESESAAFDGSTSAEIILVLGSSGAVTAVAKILVAWLDARKGRVIKINNAEFKGYSVEDAMRLIRGVPNRPKSMKRVQRVSKSPKHDS